MWHRQKQKGVAQIPYPVRRHRHAQSHEQVLPTPYGMSVTLITVVRLKNWRFFYLTIKAKRFINNILFFLHKFCSKSLAKLRKKTAISND